MPLDPLRLRGLTAPCSYGRLLFSNQLPTPNFIETPALRNGCRMLCSPHFWVQKKVWPPPHLHQPNPFNNWPVPKHSTSAPLFKLPVNFRILRWCRERSWSPRITFIWKTFEVSCYYSLFFICKIKLWNVILVVILCKLNTWPNCHVSFKRMQSLSNAFLVCMIKNQFQGSSQLFYVTL